MMGRALFFDSGAGRRLWIWCFWVEGEGGTFERRARYSMVLLVSEA